jgi:rRNA processing protein Krr1/Pno1
MAKNVRDIIRESMNRIRKGQPTDSDRAIHTLLEQQKKMKIRIDELTEEVKLMKEEGYDEVAEYKKIPWYMR